MRRENRSLAIHRVSLLHVCVALMGTALIGLRSAGLAAQAYSLDEWMSITSVGSFLWSPDGQSLYFTRDGDSGTDEIFRVPAAGGTPVQLSQNPAGVRPEPKGGIVLSPDGETIYYTSARYYQGFDNLWRMPSSGGPSEALTFNDAVIETGPELSPDGHTLVYHARTGRGVKIYLMDVSDGPTWPRLVDPGDVEERSPLFSPDGGYLAFRRGGALWIQSLDGGEPRRVVQDTYAGAVGSPVWSPDGSRIAFTNGHSGWSQVGLVDVGSGKITPITYAERDHGNIAWSPDGRTLVFTQGDTVGMANHVVTAPADGTGEVRTLTTGVGSRSSPKFSPDGRWIAYLESTDTRTRDLWKIPAGGGTPVQVTNSMGDIDPQRMSEAEEVFYPGPDNLPIPALLYRPKDFFPSQAYPVIVRLHGHPGAWQHSFEMERQYFIQQGFVLIAPNPRGSAGLGEGFHDLHIGDYGGVEFEDVMRVVPFLESLGYVDMSRKATWGGSGGGYMSFVIATKAPEVFQAQVIRAPVSDWKVLAIDRYGASARHWTLGRTPRRERSEFGGSYDEIPEEYDMRSPINFVENVQVPQLLIQGLRDASVPPRQSQIWAERMRELGKGDLLTYVELPDEDHGLRRYRSSIRRRLELMKAFFAEHLRLPELAD